MSMISVANLLYVVSLQVYFYFKEKSYSLILMSNTINAIICAITMLFGSLGVVSWAQAFALSLIAYICVLSVMNYAVKKDDRKYVVNISVEYLLIASIMLIIQALLK